MQNYLKQDDNQTSNISLTLNTKQIFDVYSYMHKTKTTPQLNV